MGIDPLHGHRDNRLAAIGRRKSFLIRNGILSHEKAGKGSTGVKVIIRS